MLPYYSKWFYQKDIEMGGMEVTQIQPHVAPEHDIDRSATFIKKML